MRFWFSVLIRCAAVAGFAALLGGCSAVPFKVSAMRFQDPDARHQTFLIAAAPTDGASETAQATNTQLADYVRSALVSRGFQAATADEQPGVLIEIQFEQKPPRIETRSTTETLYQWQPERTVLTTKKKKTSTGIVVTERVPSKIPARSEPAGKRTVLYEKELFPKRLSIVARDIPRDAPTTPGRRLWSVEVRHEDEVRDLGRFIVLMVAAARDYLGEDFSGERTVTVSRQDTRTRFILTNGSSGAKS